ncbi:cAMP dependent protein kinase [Stereum hirsutum FP-91666 SS1]|uniref:cAMP dependent protein kinase n=1 Tax=Stereum hirsutum (strain FP-91666) TaxID=721885 RepID=UPI000440CB72|nr:cAMP dependent protein kinase [Stereum hirsutum FP-91666 SS1]EIM90209.1 cAMP dependent protein kinase [Stereum hirsutum FP-91666 SS1]
MDPSPFAAAGRSSSLPTNSTSGKRTMLSFPSSPRDNTAVAGDAPITPPMTPASSDIPTDEAESEDGQPDQRPVIPVQSDAEGTDAYMESDDGSNLAPHSPPRPPLRKLENEQEHIHPYLKLTDFEVKGTLGTGTFGRVLLVRLRTAPSDARATNCFAMKVLRKTEVIRLRQVEHVKAERHILSRVRHPFIVDLYATFQDSLNIYMLLSYVPGGELFTHLRRAGRFTADVTRFYLATIVLALKYLHSFNIIYRDLKPENLLLDSRGYLRLTDFGFAKIVDDRTWTLCGTPEYLAPEIIQSDGHGKPADWWACGILAYEMMVGYPPFFDENAYGIYEKILKGKVHWPKEMDPLSRDLIKGFLHPDRSKRLGNLIAGPQDVLEHMWFRGVDWDALERRDIRAPIVPQVTSLDDTRYFTRLPLPPPEDVPGLLREERNPPLHERFDMIGFQFGEF